MTEAGKMPGAILPVDRPGKEVRVSRKWVGVIGVISLWTFPRHLSNRSVALALGYAVVLKPASDRPVRGLLARTMKRLAC